MLICEEVIEIGGVGVMRQSANRKRAVNLGFQSKRGFWEKLTRFSRDPNFSVSPPSR